MRRRNGDGGGVDPLADAIRGIIFIVLMMGLAIEKL
jgi:hypothetical protein